MHDALARDHDGSVLDSPRSAGAGGGGGQGNAILGHVLGDRQSLAEQGISQASGLDLSKVGPLLAMLAPLVMGALGRAQRDGGLDAGGLARALGGEREALGANAPGVLGAVTSCSTGTTMAPFSMTSVACSAGCSAADSHARSHLNWSEPMPDPKTPRADFSDVEGGSSSTAPPAPAATRRTPW